MPGTLLRRPKGEPPLCKHMALALATAAEETEAGARTSPTYWPPGRNNAGYVTMCPGETDTCRV